MVPCSGEAGIDGQRGNGLRLRRDANAPVATFGTRGIGPMSLQVRGRLRWGLRRTATCRSAHVRRITAARRNPRVEEEAVVEGTRLRLPVEIGIAVATDHIAVAVGVEA